MSGIYRFINTNIPTLGCNLRCEYCYIKQHGDEDVLKISHEKKLFKYSVEHMVNALSLERMGGICMFNISGSGETLLCPEIYEIVEGLLKNGHYVAIITNCTVKNVIKRFSELNHNFRERIFFKVSFHYKALREAGLLAVFSDNVKTLKKSKISFSIEIVSSDYYLDVLDEIKDFSLTEFGAFPHVLAGRDETVRGRFPRFDTKLNKEEFYDTWSSFNSDLFEFQYSDYTKPLNDIFCYAGAYTGTFDLTDGSFSACPGNRLITNFFEDINEPVKFLPVANSCPFPFCYCGFFLQVLAGSGRDAYKPNYKFYQFRDRECNDGSNWLQPSIKEVFSHRCSEFHNPLNEPQKKYITQLMSRVEFGEKFEIGAETSLELSNLIEEQLLKNSIYSIVLYGMGNLGNWLRDLLLDTSIKIICALDEKANQINARNIDIYLPGDMKATEADAIIITPYYIYTSIAPKLRYIYPNQKIISIIDLV